MHKERREKRKGGRVKERMGGRYMCTLRERERERERERGGEV